jgi:aldehyde dehydrogenase (NAD+)
VQLRTLPLAAALSAGNCVVIKPSELVPHTSSLLCSLIPRYLDTSAVTCVQGSVQETTVLLKERWDYIFFTGSEQVGRIVARAAAEHLTPITLELGGKSPVIVDQTSDLPLAVRRVLWGKLINVGQTCIAPDYCYVHEAVKSRFIDLCQSTLEQFFGKDPSQSPDLGRIVTTRHTERLKAIIDQHRDEVVVGGQVDVEGKWVSPTILDLKSGVHGKVMEEELFGPILPVIGFTELSECVRYINSKPKPLALYLFSTDQAVVKRVLNETSSGGVAINDTVMQIANKDLPFGGVGSSGMGSYHGKHGFLTLSHSKAVVHRSEWGDAPQRYPPYTAANLRVYRMILNMWRIDSHKLSMAGKVLLVAAAFVVVARLGALGRW